MENQVWPQYSQELCSTLEINHYDDEDVKEIFQEGVTSRSLLEAAYLVRQKEKSPLIKLNFEMGTEEDVDNISNLQQVLEIACSSGTMRVTLDCIENAKTEAIMLKVQAPFSALMMLVGTNRTFKWLCAYPREMHRALRLLTERTSQFCIEAISKGTPIISLADPSGMLELLGEKRYKEFCAFYMLRLLRKLYPYLDKSVAHVCPRTSLLLDKFNIVRAEVFNYEKENYADAILECVPHEDKRILGHRCINAEHFADNRIFVLTPSQPEIKVRTMKEDDWEVVSEIYSEGIQSEKVTIVKELPRKTEWFSTYEKCWVAEYLGNVIGFVAVNKKDIPELSVYIEKDFQCMGVGSALLDEVQSRMTGKIRSLIFEKNLPSVHLHEKNGFRQKDFFYFDNDTRRVLVYEWEN